MKTGIHPEYHEIDVSCACGNSFRVGSTQTKDIRVEICAQCHPIYTGKAKLVDTAGRVDKFQARLQAAQKHRQARQTHKEERKNEQAPTSPPEVSASEPIRSADL